MSTTEVSTENAPSKSLKRKADAAEIEIDVAAPEPPSKKALRKAKKANTAPGKREVLEVSDDAHVERSSQSQTQPGEDSKRSQYGIWIGNLLFTTTKEDVIKFLTLESENSISRDHITRVHLPLGTPKFGKSTNKGFAYVDFSSEQSVARAVQLSEKLLGGRRVLIKDSKDFAGRPEQKKTKDETQTRAPSKRMFVGNLDFDTTIEALEAHFGVCGSIGHTHMATFEDSGKCKGFAWVEFDQITSAESAMRGWVEAENAGDMSTNARRPKQRIWVNRLNGRKLRMEYAEDKATRYEKRFGKSAKTIDPTREGGKEQEDAIVETSEDVASKPIQHKIKPPRRKSQGKYSEETVQKLTGAIVEGKGHRTTFET